MKITIAFLALLLFLPPLCISAEEPSPHRVSFLPNWIPQAQFAGYMVALDKGFYRTAGLDLKLLRGGPGRDVMKELVDGRTTFGCTWLSVGIKARSSGVRVVNLAQIIQQSALILVAKKSSGIRSVEHLDGKKVGIWPGEFRIQPKALFRKHGLNVKIVPNYTSMNLFLKGGVQATAAMWYNEYHLLLNSGLDPDELTLFFFKDLGFDFPEDGLYTMESTFLSSPHLCRAFVSASLKGWMYAFKHKEEALDIVMTRADTAGIPTNRAHQRWMLDRMEDLILPGGDRARLGKLREQDYQLVGDVLKDLGLIARLPTYDEFYRGKR